MKATAGVVTRKVNSTTENILFRTKMLFGNFYQNQTRILSTTCCFFKKKHCFLKKYVTIKTLKKRCFLQKDDNAKTRIFFGR